MDDWAKASTEQRKRLYKAVAAAAKARREAVGVTIATALGSYVSMGRDYESNFRKGLIARSLCPIVHDWLVQHHLAPARQAAPELFPADPYHVWETALAEQAQPNLLRLVMLKRSIGLVQRADSVKQVDATLRLGEEFAFEVDAPFGGRLFAYQWHANVWHPMPLRFDASTQPLEIKPGTQILPRDRQSGEIIPMTEAEDGGLHRFAVAIMKHNQALPEDLKRMHSTSEDTELLSTSVRFI